MAAAVTHVAFSEGEIRTEIAKMHAVNPGDPYQGARRKFAADPHFYMLIPTVKLVWGRPAFHGIANHRCLDGPSS